MTLNAGSRSSFVPSANQPCFAGTVVRYSRALTRQEAQCVFEDGGIRAEAFATSGSGIERVDVTAEAKIIVSHFKVSPAPDAPSTSYLPIHVSVPVSWTGRFFNATVYPAAVGSMNMYLRLRETDEDDANVAGTLISQSRFQGASHGGISSCISIPTDEVSAATALVGCALAVEQKDEGRAYVELSGVIRVGQPYNIELVARADLTSPIVADPSNAVVPERVNFHEGNGMTWKDPAVVAIGTDAEQVVSGLRAELEQVKQDLARLRYDFDGHTHTYLTGRGEGHNNTETQTPPPILPEPPPESSDSAPVAASAQQPGSPSSSALNSTGAVQQAASQASGSGGGSLGILANLMLLGLVGRRLYIHRRRRCSGT